MRSSVHLIFLRVPWAKKPVYSWHCKTWHILTESKRTTAGSHKQKNFEWLWQPAHSKPLQNQTTNCPSHPRVNTILNTEFIIKCLFHGESYVSRCLCSELQKLLVRHLCLIATQKVHHRENRTWKPQSPSQRWDLDLCGNQHICFNISTEH